MSHLTSIKKNIDLASYIKPNCLHCTVVVHDQKWNLSLQQIREILLLNSICKLQLYCTH
jgi:hypothetical protein